MSHNGHQPGTEQTPAVDNDYPLAETEDISSQISQAQHFYDIVSILSETIADQPPPPAEQEQTIEQKQSGSESSQTRSTTFPRPFFYPSPQAPDEPSRYYGAGPLSIHELLADPVYKKPAVELVIFSHRLPPVQRNFESDAQRAYFMTLKERSKNEEGGRKLWDLGFMTGHAFGYMAAKLGFSFEHSRRFDSSALYDEGFQNGYRCGYERGFKELHGDLAPPSSSGDGDVEEDSSEDSENGGEELPKEELPVDELAQ